MTENQIPTPVEPAFSHFFSFPFDDFQIEAIGHIRDGRSVMVAAPTSSGKTVVAEYALWNALQHGSRAIYTTPIKALSNQKRRDLEALFPGQIGLLTGDRSENPDAPIVVMTTEVLRNMLVEDPDSLSWVTCVVFDEVHYLADTDRGTVWEEAIITCPQQVQLVCLSATIANAEEIAAWIGEVHRDIALVRHDERPVPLEHFYYTQGKLHLVRDQWGERRAMFVREGRSVTPYPAPVVRALDETGLLPAIWFAFSRQAVEDAAGACARAAPALSPGQRHRIDSAIAWTLDTLPAEDRNLPQLTLLMHLLRRGVGFHHAGLLPPLKELVERLFTEGLLSVVAATDTLAVGINMPARTVVISSLSRPLGGILTPNDFSQLTGRAGRRGIDQMGAVVMLPSRFHSFEEAYREVCAPLQPVLSAFRLRYSTLLSVMEGPRGHAERRLDQLVRSSLRQFQMKAAARRGEARIEQLRAQLAELGHGAGEDDLDEYLGLQSRLSEAEKEQKRARRARARSPKNPQLTRRYERAREERERLSLALRRHPRHGVAAETERYDPERLALLRQINKLKARVQNAEAECDQDAAETAEAVRSVLTALGYIAKRGMTRKAWGLREIVAPSGIVLSELYERGAFDNLDAAELAEVVSWFACDARRRDNSYRLPRRLNQLRRRAIETFRSIAALEEAERIELAQGPSDWFYGVALDWCHGASIEDITARVDLGEGDVVNLLNKTVDLLDQMEGMLARYRDDRLLDIARQGRTRLVRGLVAMVRSGDREIARETASSPIAAIGP
ncbi:MAG TPA: DEAD/DEAH box helicase [Chloroflexota bacterium]|nr:DEAD/DEAH box helicase [Chloroflexota bacterium]